MQYFVRIVLGLAVLLASVPRVWALDLNEELSVSGLLAGAVQCQSSSGGTRAENACRGALPFQPEISYHPGEGNELFVKLGFSAGNGLNPLSPFQMASWAVDMAEDLKDINGSGRNHLLTAWYKHSFTFSPRNTLKATVGIIDATEYLDENAFANDPYTQFMNAALTNGPNSFFPSYSLGAAVVWGMGRWSFHAVAMDASQNAVEKDYVFYGLEVGYRLETRLGEGNYRILLDGTSNDFFDVAGEYAARHRFLIVSFDQELGSMLGVFLRFGWQDDKVAVNYRDIYSSGVDIKGMAWGRRGDNIGLGYAHLFNGNQGISQTQIAEAYYRFAFDDSVSLSADLQYMRDSLKQAASSGGFVYGLRMLVEF